MWSFLLQKCKEDSYRPNYTTFSRIFSKKKWFKTFRKSSSNSLFLQYVCYWYNLLRWIIFVLCDNWKKLFFAKVYRYSKGFSNPHVVAFCNTGNTSVTQDDMSDTSATRVGHDCDTNDTITTRVKNFDFDNVINENIFFLKRFIFFFLK